MRLCAICVKRRAVKWELIDGRSYAVCGCGDEEVPDPPKMIRRSEAWTIPGEYEAPIRVRVLAAVRCHPGSSFDEIRELLDIPAPEYRERGDVMTNEQRAFDAASKALASLVRCGDIVRTGTLNRFCYLPAAPAQESTCPAT